MPDSNCLKETAEKPSPLRFAALTSPSPSGQESNPKLMGSSQHPMLLGFASSPKYNGFGLQPDPRHLGPSFKWCPKLLGLVFQFDPLKFV
jgi:hypothetical protein